MFPSRIVPITVRCPAGQTVQALGPSATRMGWITTAGAKNCSLSYSPSVTYGLGEFNLPADAGFPISVTAALVGNQVNLPLYIAADADDVVITILEIQLVSNNVVRGITLPTDHSYGQ